MQLKRLLSTIPSMGSPRSGYCQMLYDFIEENGLSVGVQLRTGSHISTICLAAAVKNLRNGHLTLIQQSAPQKAVPDIKETLSKADLSGVTTVVHAKQSYSWHLMKMLRSGLYEHFDFCVIESGATWTEVGYAACLAERLLKPGGWLVVDNLSFTLRDSQVRDESWVTSKSLEEQKLPQVKLVFELLIQANPHFANFRRRGPVGFAQKQTSAWSKELRRQCEREALIGSVVDRARRDPEFRDDLLHTPRRALRQFLPHSARRLAGIAFEDTKKIVAPKLLDGLGGETVYLDRPEWGECLDEETVEAMLRGAR